MATQTTTRQLNGCAAQPQVDYSKLGQDQLTEMVEAGQEIAEIYRILSKTGDNVVGEVLKNNGTFYEWDHYPPGDVYDHETHSQYYYHAHPTDQRFAHEHGHFHTFLRPKGMPVGVSPAPVPGYVPPEDANDALSHLIAIAMDGNGLPIKLFTVNRWVTGEVWYKAQDVIRMLDLFLIDHARPSWPVNRWISAIFKLYRPQISKLLVDRDVAVKRWQQQHNPQDVYEDRKLEVTSYLDIDVPRDLVRIESTLAQAS